LTVFILRATNPVVATQAEKTAATRQKLLDATIAVLIERGYKSTSTPLISRRARVSRGGQLHHFATKQDLVAAAVEHLFRRRLDELGARLAAAPGGMLDLRSAATHLLEVYSGETFYAWLELLVAARTDRALKRRLVALDAQFVAGAEQLCRAYLLPHAGAEEVRATTRLILAIFDGLATHRIIADDDKLSRRALGTAARAGLFTPKKGSA
jgi:AcrR family transcriptional regulator